MELKDVYTALESIENGSEMIAVIKAETTRLSNEAKKHRVAGEGASAKAKSLMEAFGLDDGDDVVDRAREMKGTLDSFAQGAANNKYNFDDVGSVRVDSIETEV